jgi:ABC-type transport system involved in multi-copper enzyme maturation permease subunit
MSIRRRGLWVAYALLFVFHTVILFSPPPLGEWVDGEVITRGELWSAAGRFLVAVNVFFPVVAGILSADRVQRDFRSGVRELQDSTPLTVPVYLFAKYMAALTSCLLPLFLWVMTIAIVMTAVGHAPAGFLYTVPLAFLAITVPAFAFVAAFSIACPLIMPLPVYQVLFTGYWFWANFVPPALFPTLNGTLFTPSGMYALQGFFGGPVAAAYGGARHLGRVDALLNLGVLAACIAAAFVFLERVLSLRASRS